MSRQIRGDAPCTFSGRPMSPKGKALVHTTPEALPSALTNPKAPRNMHTLIANHNRRVKMRRAFDLIAPVIPALILATFVAFITLTK